MDASGDVLIETITLAGAAAVIPPRSNRATPRFFDKHQYQHRNLIEQFFCRMKHFRRIAARYDKLASHLSSVIALVAAFTWLGQMATGPNHFAACSCIETARSATSSTPCWSAAIDITGQAESRREPAPDFSPRGPA